jgi:hypothetical protein
MRTYTLEEVSRDIYNFEGLEITNTSTGSHFSKLYSDFYELPLDRSKTVDDFKLRFFQYASACRVIDVDKKPTPGKKVSIYRYELKDGFPNKGYLVDELDDHTKTFEVLDRENINQAMIYIHESAEYFFINRQTH